MTSSKIIRCDEIKVGDKIIGGEVLRIEGRPDDTVELWYRVRGVEGSSRMPNFRKLTVQR